MTAFTAQPGLPVTLKGDPQAQAGFAVTKRILMLGLLTLILMAPLETIRGLLWERQSRGYDVENEIAAQWGGAQRIAGPETHAAFLDANGGARTLLSIARRTT